MQFKDGLLLLAAAKAAGFKPDFFIHVTLHFFLIAVLQLLGFLHFYFKTVIKTAHWTAHK